MSAASDAATADPREARLAAMQRLLDSLEREPWAHDFFALMRQVESLTPDMPRLGRAQRPTQEPLRLGQVAELDFAPAAIASFSRTGATSGRLGVRFFGMLGSHGPLPLHLTEYIRERRHQHADPTLERFLDIFHHRMLSLFYRAWAQAQPPVQLDRPADDRYAAWLGATFGLGPGTNQRDSIPDAAKRFFAGHLGNRSRHPEALVKVLQQYFGIPAALQSHVAHWMPVHVEDRSRLGFAANRAERRGQGFGLGAQLGRSANAGSKVYDRQFKFRVALGPMSLQAYQSFLPGGRAWTELRDWIKLLSGGDMLWDVQLGLREAEVPAPRLGRHIRLGLTAWIGGKPSPASAANSSAPRVARGAPNDRWDLKLRPSSSQLLQRTGAVHG